MGLPEGENLRLQCLIQGTVMAPDSEPNTEEHSHVHSLQVALREGNEGKGGASRKSSAARPHGSEQVHCSSRSRGRGRGIKVKGTSLMKF